MGRRDTRLAKGNSCAMAGDAIPRCYRGRAVALATMHAKERAIARPMRAGLGARVVVPTGIDTDALGTFTGEIARVGTPATVALAKARLGMEHAGLPLGMASEGSFGPHPALPFLTIDEEFLVFVDDVWGMHVIERLVTTATNAASTEATESDELARFLRQVGFPTHAVIVRPACVALPGPITRGITDGTLLQSAIARCQAASGARRVCVETDLRAHVNPTRMRAIRRLAVRLARRLRTACPACGAPGWGTIDVERGLPCAQCGQPTDLVLREIAGCARCAFRRTQPRQDGRSAASPGECAWCNP